jgi:hypothetical protein
MLDFLPAIARVAGFLLATFPGGILVRRILKPFSGPGTELGGMEKAGRLIGYLERSIVVVLVFNGAYSAIGFVFAAKSIARFNRLRDREVAEYYLVGTLGSVTWAVVVGELTNFGYEILASLF